MDFNSLPPPQLTDCLRECAAYSKPSFYSSSHFYSFLLRPTTFECSLCVCVQFNYFFFLFAIFFFSHPRCHFVCVCLVKKILLKNSLSVKNYLALFFLLVNVQTKFLCIFFGYFQYICYMCHLLYLSNVLGAG